jgi:type IV pilus assembly protein PilY1
MPNLYKLADKSYGDVLLALHQYSVNATPAVGDICVSGCGAAGATWRTILVGGLGRGGRGYYALDITNPAAPVVLWEFTDTNLGYSYGNPIITKQKDGRWVVLVTSGYHNISPGDGVGRLYVLDAVTGAKIREISTGVGSASDASGLARINAWVARGMYDNTSLRVYGGDLRGNLWRFDINGDVGATGYDAQLLASLKNAAGQEQPITTRPELGNINGYTVVFVGTGRYLGSNDQTNTNQQSLYAVKDTLSTTSYNNPRTLPGFVQQTVGEIACPSDLPLACSTATDPTKTVTRNTVNFAKDNGWYLDFQNISPNVGERVNNDPILLFGTLLITSNVPDATPCSAGGHSFRYFLDYRTGGALAPAVLQGAGGSWGPGGSGGGGSSGSGDDTPVAGQKIGNAIASGSTVARLSDGSIIEIIQMADGTKEIFNVPFDPDAGTRRLSWRELRQE